MTVGLASNQASPEVTVNQMVDGYFEKSVAGTGTLNLSDLEATWSVIKLTGALTGAREVTIPDVMNTLIVSNSTSGAYSLTVKSLTGSGVVIPQGETRLLYCDGTNVLEADVVPITLSAKVLGKNTQQASAPASSSGTLTLDLNNGLEFNTTLTEAITTLTISNVPSGISYFTLDITQDGAGGWAVTWPASVKWAGGSAPTLTTTAGANSVLTFRTKDSGATWQGMLFGDDIK